MNKNTRIKSDLFILAVISCAVLFIACDGSNRDTPENRAEKMNDYIRRTCKTGNRGFTESEMKLCLNNFYEIQNKYSGKLFFNRNDKKYYYPKFVCERLDSSYTVTKNTRYEILSLERDANGVYKGIKVIAYEDEAAQKIVEVNKELKRYTSSYCTREYLDTILAKYKTFQDKYNGKLLCEDARGKKIYCPEFTYGFDNGVDEHIFINRNIKQMDWDSQIFWRVELMDKDDAGFCKGIKFVHFDVSFRTGEVVTTKEFVRDETPFIPEVPFLEIDKDEKSKGSEGSGDT